jgi:hypothetical protein
MSAGIARRHGTENGRREKRVAQLMVVVGLLGEIGAAADASALCVLKRLTGLLTLQAVCQSEDMQSGTFDGRMVQYSGISGQTVDGSGDTGHPPHGRVNVIIGYNEHSDPPNERTGPHHVVIGLQPTYSGARWLVAGHPNAIRGEQTTVSGRSFNMASGGYAAVSGDKDSTLSGMGTSAPFEIGTPVPGWHYLLATKDVNNAGTLDAGDVIEGVRESDGSLKLLQPPITGLALAMTVVPTSQSSVPAELVGTWSSVGGEAAIGVTINANATYARAYRYETARCIVIKKIEITEQGHVNTRNDQITFVPEKEPYVSTNCTGTPTTKPPNLIPSIHTWRVSVDAATRKPILYLKDQSTGNKVVLAKR